MCTLVTRCKNKVCFNLKPAFICILNMHFSLLKDIDDEARVQEALTKTIVCALKSAPSLDNDDHWLNPTEVFTIAHIDTVREILKHLLCVILIVVF